MKEQLPVDSESAEDLARHTPDWIRDGFADAGATHEPWIFQVRRNSSTFNQWQRETYDYHLSEEYIKSLSEAGITVYHVFLYKGFGFEAEEEHMASAAKAAAIAHKYGLKVDTYIQWNTFAYETFFAEVPESETDVWYQIDVNGKPIMLSYGYQQSFRFRPCFNHEAYMDYYKEKILRYAVEQVKTDFIHFDNFGYDHPNDADHNPATIAAFITYLEDKYAPAERRERFGFADLSHVRPPMWNDANPAGGIVVINDPLIQEWVDFRCWTLTTRLAECARFVRELNKEIVIETNPHGLVGSNRAWEAGINHPDLMQYTNVIWTEDANYPRWENGVVIGKFRHYKLGRTTDNFILTYNREAQDFAENLALNRTIAWLGIGIPTGVAKTYLDFRRNHKELYINMSGAEKVAVLRSYPSMAYNCRDTQLAVNMAEQVLQQRQIPFDIVFDQQLDKLGEYYVIILADQESLADETLESISKFVKNGGGLVATGNTGLYDQWRRLRKTRGFEDIFGHIGADFQSRGDLPAEAVTNCGPRAVEYGNGRAVYLPELVRHGDAARLGYSTRWEMPENAGELASVVLWAAGERLPLTVSAPEWVGVSHDTQSKREVIHLFNYRSDQPVAGIVLQYHGDAKTAWAVSPDRDIRMELNIERDGNTSVLRIPQLDVYEVVVLEK